MWYEILPSMAIIGGLLGVPAIFMAGLHKVVYDNYYQRELNSRNQRGFYLRDERLSGLGWKSIGLENIPDEEAKE